MFGVLPPSIDGEAVTPSLISHRCSLFPHWRILLEYFFTQLRQEKIALPAGCQASMKKMGNDGAIWTARRLLVRLQIAKPLSSALNACRTPPASFQFPGSIRAACGRTGGFPDAVTGEFNWGTGGSQIFPAVHGTSLHPRPAIYR
jgi:hypothetical protein